MMPAETEGQARQGRRRPGPHPRGETVLRVHPDRPRSGRPPGPRPALLLLPGHLRPRRRVRDPDGRRGPPPRRRSHPPARHPGRRRGLDLEPRHPVFPRGHPDRRFVPRPRAPARARETAGVHARRPQAALARCSGSPSWIAGDIPAICAAARVFPLAGRKAADLTTALGYFEHNAHRMHYAHFKSLGMFVGSGAVEAACKSDRRPANANYPA